MAAGDSGVDATIEDREQKRHQGPLETGTAGDGEGYDRSAHPVELLARGLSE